MNSPKPSSPKSIKETLAISGNPAFSSALSQLIQSEVLKAGVEDEDSLLFQLNEIAADAAWGAINGIVDAHTARQAADLLTGLH